MSLKKFKITNYNILQANSLEVENLAYNIYYKLNGLGILPKFVQRDFSTDRTNPINIESLSSIETATDTDFTFEYAFDSVGGNTLTFDSIDTIGKNFTVSFEFKPQDATFSFNLAEDFSVTQAGVTLFSDLTLSYSFADDTFYVVKIVKSNIGVTLYVNGTEVDSGTLTSNFEFSLGTNFFENVLGNVFLGNAKIKQGRDFLHWWKVNNVQADGTLRDVGKDNEDKYMLLFTLATITAYNIIYSEKVITIEDSLISLRRYLGYRGLAVNNGMTLSELSYVYENWFNEFKYRGTELVYRDKETDKGRCVRRAATAGLELNLDTNISTGTDKVDISFDWKEENADLSSYVTFCHTNSGAVIQIKDGAVSGFDVTVFGSSAIAIPSDYETTLKSVKIRLISNGSNWDIYLFVNDNLINETAETIALTSFDIDYFLGGDIGKIANIRLKTGTDEYLWQLNEKGFFFKEYLGSNNYLKYVDTTLSLNTSDDDFANLHYSPVYGEMKRMLDFNAKDEFISAKTGRGEYGWSLGNSSPTSLDTYNVSNLNKISDYDKDLSRLPVNVNEILPTVTADGLEVTLPAAGIFELGEQATSLYGVDFLIPFERTISYALAIKVNLPAGVELSFGCFCYDESLVNYANTGLGGNVDNYFIKDSTFYSDNFSDTDLVLRGILYGENFEAVDSRNILGDTTTGHLNILESELEYLRPHLKLVNTTGSPVTATIKDFKLQPLRSNVAKGRLDGGNRVIVNYIRDNSGKFDADLQKLTESYFNYGFFIKNVYLPGFYVITTKIITILSPNGGETFMVDDTANITWEYGGTDTVTIEYYNGTSWILIESGVDNTGGYNWTVPDINVPDALIKITSDDDASVFDVSDATFEIKGTAIQLTTDQTTPEPVDFSFIFATSQTMKVDYGDGTQQELTGTSLNFTHTYTTPGTYVIKVVSTSYDFLTFTIANEKITSFSNFDDIVTAFFGGNGNLYNTLDLTKVKLTGSIRLRDSLALQTVNHKEELQTITTYEARNTGLVNLNLSFFTFVNLYLLDVNNFEGITHREVMNTCSEYYITNGKVTSLDLSYLKISLIFDVRGNSINTITHATELFQLNTNYNVSNNSLTQLDLGNVEFVTLNLFDANRNFSLQTITHCTNSMQTVRTYNVSFCNFSTLDLSFIKITNQFICNNNANLASLTHSSAAGQTINRYDAYNCSIGVIEFEKLDLQNNCNIRLENNNMTAAEVNENLVKVDSDGAINGTLNISGTNAAPDSTSGGFDGLAAITSLQAKGWTITTS